MPAQHRTKRLACLLERLVFIRWQSLRNRFEADLAQELQQGFAFLVGQFNLDLHCGALSRGIFPVSSRKPSHRADCESKRRRCSHSCARSQATSEHTPTLAERLFAT